MMTLSGLYAPLSAALPQRLRRLARGSFLRNVALVAGGTAVAQVVTIAFSPIITRLYGPEALGILGVFLAVLTVVTPIASLSYHLAIVLPATDDEARVVFKLALLLGGLVTALATLLVAGLHQPIAAAIGFAAPSAWLLLVPLVILLFALAEPLRSWLIRKKQFRVLPRIAIAEAAADGTFKSLVGLLVATAPTLLVLQVATQALRTLLMWLGARGTLLARDPPPAPAAGVGFREVAHRYRDFPLFRAPQVWLNAISHSLPTLMLAALIGPAAAGFYTIARRVLGLPSTLVSGAVGTVFLPRIAEARHRDEPLRPLILKGTVGLALAGLAPFGTVIAFGPFLFGLVFGPEWTTAGEYARWLALWLYFMFLNVPAVQSIPVLGLQAHFLAYEVGVIVLRAASLAIGALVLESDMSAIALFSLSGTLANLGLVGWVLKMSATRRR